MNFATLCLVFVVAAVLCCLSVLLASCADKNPVAPDQTPGWLTALIRTIGAFVPPARRSRRCSMTGVDYCTGTAVRLAGTTCG